VWELNFFFPKTKGHRDSERKSTVMSVSVREAKKQQRERDRERERESKEVVLAGEHIGH